MFYAMIAAYCVYGGLRALVGIDPSIAVWFAVATYFGLISISDSIDDLRKVVDKILENNKKL
jgi:hypothetical protein